MWYWWFLLVCDLICPVGMMIGGRWMWKRPAKQINGLVGYRTARSMKNRETWRFAQEYNGRLMWKYGSWLLLPAVAVPVLLYGSTEKALTIASCVLWVVELAALLIPIPQTEKALKAEFPDKGEKG